MDTHKKWAFRDLPLAFFSASKDTNHYSCDGFFRLGDDLVILIRMETIAADSKTLHLDIVDFDALPVGSAIKRAGDRESGIGCGRGDQFDDSGAVSAWPAVPILCDLAEHPILGLVSLQGVGRIVVNLDRRAGVVGELLHLDLSPLNARTIRAAAIGCDHQFTCARIALPLHFRMLWANGRHGELGCVVCVLQNAGGSII